MTRYPDESNVGRTGHNHSSGWRMLATGLSLIILGAVVLAAAIHFVSGLARQQVLSDFSSAHQEHHSHPESGQVEPADSLEAPPLPTLRIAVAPVISPEKSLLLYQDFVQYVASRLDLEGEIVLRSNYLQTNQVLQDGRADAGLVCTYGFVRAQRDFGARVVAVPVVNGGIKYHSVVIVPADTKTTRLDQLAGKRFASADLMSTTGWLYPAVSLLNEGHNPESFFSEHQITGSHDRSILAVAQGEADGAAVHGLVYQGASPALRSATRVISRSPDYGMPPLISGSGLTASLEQRLQAVLLTAHENPEGLQMLRQIGIDRFVAPQAGLYDGVVALVERWEQR